MGSDGTEERAARWRARATGALVPHVAHKVNNALAVVLGMTDLLARGRDGGEGAARAAAAHEHADLASRLLVELCELAAGVGGPAPADAGAVLDVLAGLFEGAAKAARHDLVVARPAGILVEVDAPTLTLLGAAMAWTALGGPEADRAACGARGPGVLRLAARPGRDGLASLAVSAQRTDAAPPPTLADADREDLETLAAAAGGTLRVRCEGRRLGLSLSLPARDVGPVEVPRAPRRAAARLVVVESDPMLAELLGEVLREVGHEVAVHLRVDDARADLGGGVGLVLVDAALRAELEDDLAGRDLAILTLGRGPAPALAKPFRPAELLEAVRDALS